MLKAPLLFCKLYILTVAFSFSSLVKVIPSPIMPSASSLRLQSRIRFLRFSRIPTMLTLEMTKNDGVGVSAERINAAVTASGSAIVRMPLSLLTKSLSWATL